MGVVEYNGSIYNQDGLDPLELEKYFTKNKSFRDFPNGQFHPNQEIMYKPCDILVPAALQLCIQKDNMKKIQAKIILEVANGPTSIEADEYFDKQKILVIPDILVNAGGVTCSYIEWLKNRENKRTGRLTQKWEEKSK